MFKLSKESKITFIGLLIVPLIWIALNHFGILDLKKNPWSEHKSLDLRFGVRGNLSHREGAKSAETVQVENNKIVPRIPKVIYMNFDEATVSMPEIGERPWSRKFFREVSEILMEKGKARVLAFDFIFGDKSMSSMVPEQNVYASDSEMAKLVERYPNQIVLASNFANVLNASLAAPMKKGTLPFEVSAAPPYLRNGYSLTRMEERYPESPSYPIFSYREGEYFGKSGIILIADDEVDGALRFANLWYPRGQKAHAYNILMGKQGVLALEGVEFNEYNATELIEVGDELQLVWRDSNNTLVKTVPNSMPLTRERAFYTLGLESLMAYYGVDHRSVEVLDGNKRLVLRSLAGETLVDAPLQHGQGIEINWFSNWKEELPLEKDFEKARELYNQGNFDDYVQVAPKVIRGALKRIKGLKLPEGDLECIEALEALELGSDSKEREEFMKTAKQLVFAAQGKIDPKSAPDFVKLKTLVSEISREYLPPYLLSPYNPMCSMADVLEYNELLNGIEQAKASILSLEGVLSRLRYIHYKYSEHNESKSLWGTIDKLDSNQTAKRNSLLVTLDQMEEELDAFKNSSGQIDSNTSANRAGREFAVLYQKLKDFQLVQSLPAKKRIEKLKILEKNHLVIESEVNELKKRVEQFPALSAVIQNSQIGPKEKELGELEKKIAELDDVSVEKQEEKKFGILSEVNELKKRVEQFPALSAVIQNSQIDPKEKEIKEIEKRIDKLKEIAEVVADLTNTEVAPVAAQAISKVKALLAYNKSMLPVAPEIKRKKYLSFFAEFEDAIVLFGPVDKSFNDLGQTPIDEVNVPKVSAHGNVIKTLASGIYLKRFFGDKFSVALISFIFSLILGYFAVNNAPWSNWAGLIVFTLFIVASLLLFNFYHIVIPLAVPSLAGVSTFFIGLIVMMVLEQKAKGRLKGMFGSYVSAELVDQMVESGEEPHLGGEETAITAFFSDVQAFSSFSELLTPTGLVDLMNEYLTAMTDILQKERGTLDKYIGDAIVAMYGAPIPMKDHAYQSVRTALLMQEKQLELRDKWAMEEDKWGKCYGLVKQMQTRIGCNTGTATVGNMGALDRFNYTMMGDMVNLAARCESGAKAYGAYIMITEETKLASEKTKDDIAFRYLDKIVVKGRSQPVSMYEPTGFMADLGQETQDCLDCFRQGIDKYLLQDWDSALKMFEKAKDLEPNKPGVTPGVKDNPSMILIDRCQVMKENPPGDDWDGVYVMTSK